MTDPTLTSPPGGRRRRVVVAAIAATTIALLVSLLPSLQPASTAAEMPNDAKPLPANAAVATFAAGCFWCVESDFDKVEGVISTTSGYTGGRTPNPDYDSVSTGRTGHTEALQVVYDPAKVSYEGLLATFWHNVDPVDGGGQFCDRGNQYRPAVFVHTPEQRKLAEASRTALEKSGRFGRPIVVPILDAAKFTPAEPEHQDFHHKNPIRYAIYRHGCGRDQRLRQLWINRPSG